MNEVEILELQELLKWAKPHDKTRGYVGLDANKLKRLVFLAELLISDWQNLELELKEEYP